MREMAGDKDGMEKERSKPPGFSQYAQRTGRVACALSRLWVVWIALTVDVVRQELAQLRSPVTGAGWRAPVIIAGQEWRVLACSISK